MKDKIIYRKGVPTNDLYDRNELLRVVKTHTGLVKIDLTNSIKGRGIYLIKDIKQFQLVKKKRLIEKGLRIKSNLDSIYEEIENLLHN